jgi:hypothetical protein
MTIYISNVNGDWWEYDSRAPLYILDTDELNAVQLAEIEEEHYGLENDKFEQVIMEFGKTVYLTEVI